MGVRSAVSNLSVARTDSHQWPIHRFHGPLVSPAHQDSRTSTIAHELIVRMHEFNQSLKYDKRMYAADIKGSIAFSKALLKAGILNEKEQAEITRGLKQVEQEWAEGKVRR